VIPSSPSGTIISRRFGLTYNPSEEFFFFTSRIIDGERRHRNDNYNNLISYQLKEE
jgi:hypothetical protein